MTTRSIFQKICPACMNTLPLDAGHCACGHEFDHEDSDVALSSEEIRLKAEELYENYLAARAEQAANAVMTAQAEFARDPDSSQKSQRVASAIEESETARAALAAQSAHVAELKKALPKSARSARPARTLPALPKKRAIPAKPVPLSPPSRVRAEVRTVNAAPNTSVTTFDRSKRLAKKAVAALAKNRAVPAPVAVTPEIKPPPAVQSRTPNPAFRQAQAAKAEKILRKAETAVAVKEVIREEIVAATKITVAPKPEPALPPPVPLMRKSAPRLLGPDNKECPNCTGSVDNKVSRCRCGYEFPASETLMPTLSMSEDERAEFAKLFGAL